MLQKLPKHRAREYETIFILTPEIASEQIEQISMKMTEVISRLDGKLLHAENWGRRRLAYPVGKHQKGTYIYLRYLGYSDMVHEVERNIRMNESIIKHLTVKIDEDVNPEARPVNEGDISFSPQFEDHDVEEPVILSGYDSERVEEDGDDVHRPRRDRDIEPVEAEEEDDLADDESDDDEEEV